MTISDRSVKLLVVDDSPDTRELLERNLSSQGYIVLTAADVAQALNILGKIQIDIVITDLKLPGVSGLDLVRHVRENLKDTEVVMITGYPSVEGAVAAVKSGAEEYLAKPFTKEELIATVRRVMEKLKTRLEGTSIREQSAANPLGIVGNSESMQRLLRAISRSATASAPVLFTGEKGTGKESWAGFLHHLSLNSTGPLVTIAAAGIPEETLERQMFGCALTPGGEKIQSGYLHFARGGTLYIKEISDLPQGIQARLMQVIREKRFIPAGMPKSQSADFLLVADTHKDLRALVSRGLFREDLFAGLSMNEIHIPALRQLDHDIILLARYFLQLYSLETDGRDLSFSMSALDAIKTYSWPGNIDEMANVIRHLVISTETSVIDITDLPAHMRYSAVKAVTLGRSLADVEAEHIRNVVAGVGGNKVKAAEILGINRKTLRDKLKHIDQREPSG
jgi:two-component system response regulator HydG